MKTFCPCGGELFVDINGELVCRDCGAIVGDVDDEDL